MEVKKDYRPDIDGLRALAVISVILFHMDNSFLPGGFIGVDIFFVISGYLITKHLVENKINNNHSLRIFYFKRIKRILPALFFMIFVTLIFSYFTFSPYYLDDTAKQSFSALLSFSNIYFYFNSDYFDISSTFRPLLHTWSLGVEEQFYLFWPIFIIVLLNINKFNKIWVKTT